MTDSADRLYAMIGDLNRNGQLQNNAGGAAPDDSSVILRVNSDGTPAAGNPFTPYCSVTTTQTCTIDANCPAGQTCRTQVARYYAYGIRNSFGMAIDPVTGALWDTENGPADYDEVNRINPGFNSGWNQIMGPDSRDPQGVGNLFNMPGAGSTYSDPEFSWLATIAPTAILFPRGRLGRLRRRGARGRQQQREPLPLPPERRRATASTSPGSPASPTSWRTARPSGTRCASAAGSAGSPT